MLYVGRRLTKRPRFGTKREFWTFVSVESVATSGSVHHISSASKVGEERREEKRKEKKRGRTYQ
jgi:hypothetical protein